MSGSVAFGLCVLLGACGGGGGDGGGGEGGDTNGSMTGGGSDLIIGTAGGRAASEVSEEELRSIAAKGAARGIGVNLGNLRRMDDGDEPAAPDSGSGMDDELIANAERANQSFNDHLLGVDDPGAVVVREGDLITIDPDDAALCGDDYALFGGSSEATSEDGAVASPPADDPSSDCRRLAADLTVELDARSEDSGVVTLLFAGSPVLATGYSPAGGSAELYLSGVRTVIERVATLDIEAGVEPEPLPLVLSGTLRLDARILEDREGAEAAEIELSVTEAIEIGDGGTSGFSLAPSRVFLLGTDAATGEARLSVGWGALRLAAESGDSDGNRSTTEIELGGLTFDLAAAEGATAFSFRNVGIGDVPLTVRVDEGDALSLVLETFGLTVDTGTETISVDTAVGIDLMIDNLGGLIDERAREYIASFTARVPAGTRLRDRGQGVTEVVEGGPLTASLIESDNGGSSQSEISAGVGTCFGSLPDDDATPSGGAFMSGDVTDGDDDPFDGLGIEVRDCP